MVLYFSAVTSKRIGADAWSQLRSIPIIIVEATEPLYGWAERIFAALLRGFKPLPAAEKRIDSMGRETGGARQYRAIDW